MHERDRPLAAAASVVPPARSEEVLAALIGKGSASQHGAVQSGGFIEVESEVGRGTIFRAHFPVPSGA